MVVKIEVSAGLPFDTEPTPGEWYATIKLDDSYIHSIHAHSRSSELDAIKTALMKIKELKADDLWLCKLGTAIGIEMKVTVVSSYQKAKDNRSFRSSKTRRNLPSENCDYTGSDLGFLDDREMREYFDNQNC